MKTIIVVGLPGVGKTTLLERWQAQPDLPSTQFTVEQPERIFVERDLVLDRDGAYTPTGLSYREAELDHLRSPAADAACVRELNQWTDLIRAVEARSASPRRSGEQAEVPTVITVVDASSILKMARQFVALTGEDTTREGRSIHGRMGALLEGIFLADRVVLNKCDLVSDEERDRAEQLIHHFHADVPVIKTQFGDVPWQIVWTEATRAESRLAARRKLDDFHNAHPPKPGDPSLTDFFYRARRPFHPQRFEILLRKLLNPGICLRGYFWLATRMDWAGYILGTSSTLKLYGLGHWLASWPETGWSQTLRHDVRRQAIWDQAWGDRRQELWITAFPQFFEGLRAQLDAALLDDEEMKAGPEGWSEMTDPWPAWRFEFANHDPTASHGHDHAHDENGHCCGHSHDHAKPSLSHGDSTGSGGR
jgi:G3E family GTPase